MHQHFPCFLICRHSMPICNPVDVTDTFYLHFLRTLAMHCDKKLWMTGTLSRCEWPQSMLWISLSLKDYLSVCHCHFHFRSVNTHIQTVSSQPIHSNSIYCLKFWPCIIFFFFRKAKSTAQWLGAPCLSNEIKPNQIKSSSSRGRIIPIKLLFTAPLSPPWLLLLSSLNLHCHCDICHHHTTWSQQITSRWSSDFTWGVFQSTKYILYVFIWNQFQWNVASVGAKLNQRPVSPFTKQIRY